MIENGIFVWSESFETKLEDVDNQHKYLIEQVNILSSKLLDNTLTPNDLDDIFKKLVDYTVFHFSHEESLMKTKKVYEEHTKEHIRNHKAFVNEVGLMYSEINSQKGLNIQKAINLRDFLFNWLAFHILEQDHQLAKQLFLINKGFSPKEAFEQVSQKKDKRTLPLVKALKGIMNVLSKRNKDLLELKASLEIKVQERTKELIEANKTLEHLSLTDTLTKLANRRFAMRSLNALWKELAEYGYQFSVLMIDADHFKEVNDTCGHDAGDLVLQKIAICIKDSVRTDDVVCRLGGDEFFVICPNTDLKGGILVANNIHGNINRLKVKISEDRFYHGSVSIGVACSKGAKNVDELIKQADDYVYEAKKDGRNCVKHKQVNFYENTLRTDFNVHED